MTGNFDSYYTINNNSDNADLTPYWETAEADYISNIEMEWWGAICADDYAWEVCADKLHAIVRETEDILAGYGIRPTVAQAYEKYGFI